MNDASEGRTAIRGGARDPWGRSFWEALNELEAIHRDGTVDDSTDLWYNDHDEWLATAAILDETEDEEEDE